VTTSRIGFPTSPEKRDPSARETATVAVSEKEPLTVRATHAILVVSLLVAIVAGCGGGTSGGSAKSMTLYTCASANVEQAVITGFTAAHSGTEVNVFRAPTGQLNARVAADKRSGGIQADVIWACDPLTMYGYDGQGLLRAWRPPNASQIPSPYRTAHFTGIDVLYMVLVARKDAPHPATWADLRNAAYKGKIAIASPTFAASALGMLGYFASAKTYGIDFYRDLKKNGAVQVDAPADVLTGVEQGTYLVGATLANAAYVDQHKGSPIDVLWPVPGAVAIYAPIALTTKKHPSPLAEEFANYAASRAGQKVMADQGTYPAIAGLGGPPIPAGSPIASPDWAAMSGGYRSMLAEYAKIFGG
jgi:iron(III) transport system substrate-binding protein